jgi:broad specificity phosphatase PhoE
LQRGDNMTEVQQFVVIRHGESQTNATDTFQAGNQYDSDPLTPLGMEGARHLAKRFAVLPVDLVVSSSYLRARTTAGLIAEATQAPHLVPVQKDSSWVDLPADDPEVRNRASLLREIDVPSELQGLKFDDPRANEIQHAAMSVAEQPDGHYSDEENLHDLWRRAEEIRRNLEERAGRLTVVVAHGGILKVWLAHLMFTAVRGLDAPQHFPRTADSAGSVGGQHRRSLAQVQPGSRLALADD